VQRHRNFHAMRYNYSLLDAGGHAAVVEAAPAAFAVRRGEWLACTNHFQSYAMKLYNRAHKSSWTRLPPLETWADQNLPAGSMFEAFNASTSPAFFSNYDGGRSGTLHTFVSEPKRRRIQIGIRGDSKQFE
jgi:predicted choloylglycine hydrolase